MSCYVWFSFYFLSLFTNQTVGSGTELVSWIGIWRNKSDLDETDMQRVFTDFRWDFSLVCGSHKNGNTRLALFVKSQLSDNKKYLQENTGIKRKAEGGSPPPAKQPALSSSSSARREPTSQAGKRPSKVAIPPSPVAKAIPPSSVAKAPSSVAKAIPASSSVAKAITPSSVAKAIPASSVAKAIPQSAVALSTNSDDDQVKYLSAGCLRYVRKGTGICFSSKYPKPRVGHTRQFYSLTSLSWSVGAIVHVFLLAYFHWRFAQIWCTTDRKMLNIKLFFILISVSVIEIEPVVF